LEIGELELKGGSITVGNGFIFTFFKD